MHHQIRDFSMKPLTLRFADMTVDDIRKVFKRKSPEELQEERENVAVMAAVYEQYKNVDFVEQANKISRIDNAISFLQIAYDKNYAKKMVEEMEEPLEALKYQESVIRKAEWMKPKPIRKGRK